MKRAGLLGLALLLALPVLALGGVLLFLDADAFRPRLAEAVQRATGREFRIEGPLRLTPALTPTLAADGLVLANSPGGSAAEMLRIGHAELRLALWPLLTGRIEVASLRLEGGRLLLERENWRFTRPAAASPATAAAPSPTTPSPTTPGPATTPPRPLALDLRTVILRDWRVTANGEEFRLPQLRLSGSGPDQPLDLTATLILRGAEALIEGRLASPMAMGGASPWPFRLGVVLPGARLSAEGRQAGGDWVAALTAEIPRLDSLGTLAGRALPALTGLSLRAQATLTAGIAQISAIEGQVGGGAFAGLTITSARFTQASLDAPLIAEASGAFRGEALALTAEVRPAALIAGVPAPFTLGATAANATARLAGEWPGALRLDVTVPELARLSALAGRPLPPLRDATLRAGFTALGPMFGEGARIGEFALASSAGDLAGALEWRWAPRPAVSGRVTSTRLDLNALRLPPAPALPAPVAGPAAATAPAPAPSPPPAPSGRVIPETPLDLAALNLFDADLEFVVAELLQGGLVLRQMEGRLVNAAGRARLEPFAATLPGGRLALALAADATGAAPAVQIRGGGQGLDPVALLGAFGVASPLTGRSDLDLDLRGQGANWRALAGNATGHLGLAVIEGRLSGGPAQALAQLPGFAGGVPVNCLALRGEADRGLVRFTAFYLDGAAGRLGGEGGMSLRDETLAIRMQADLRLAGVRVRAPVPLTGTLAAPRLEVSALTEGALGSVLGAPPPPSQGLPDCATTLRIARGGRDGALPAAAPPAATNAPATLNNLLRGLLGR
ncbi:AsmA family protein [Sediminicoccus sp. KRV36]|uniref:AsmA family protein n=1 Tax=Sediminicoccus sp. KRV36 TaxID=3133721 RepID=UPI00200EDF38|nr:AsmA family protein [Sediminicoccus rosea]UPY36229.1 AsmA family protein [Sediminicoccus rosea]